MTKFILENLKIHPGNRFWPGCVCLALRRAVGAWTGQTLGLFRPSVALSGAMKLFPAALLQDIV